jgi:hypothetical protein
LSRQGGALCVFGHNLDSDDLHILQALRESPLQALHVSIFPLSDAWVISQKQRYTQLLDGSGKVLSFFDATSHPLGRPSLNVPVEKAGKKRR